MICPIVIRDGIACGLIIKSGRIPSAVKGISCSGIISPMVPFCPEREAILSPIAGIRSSLIRTFAILNPSSPVVKKDLSTKPNCPFLVFTDSSNQTSLFSRSEVIFPITMILSFNGVFSFTNP